jgi:hypothetical protein
VKTKDSNIRIYQYRRADYRIVLHIWRTARIRMLSSKGMRLSPEGLEFIAG